MHRAASLRKWKFSREKKSHFSKKSVNRHSHCSEFHRFSFSGKFSTLDSSTIFLVQIPILYLIISMISTYHLLGLNDSRSF